MLQVIDTKVASCKKNMQVDTELLENLDPSGDPLLHFYGWQGDSLTYGYFIKPEKFINLKVAKEKRLSLAKRPTGGGIVFHIWDLAFSFLMPKSHPTFFTNSLENYNFVNSIVLEAVEKFRGKGDMEATTRDFKSEGDCFNFCMARPTKYDVICGGRKVAGAAQRRGKNGYLHQGTISLMQPERQYLEDVLIDREVVDAILRFSYPLITGREIDLEEAKQLLCLCLYDHFREKV